MWCLTPLSAIFQLYRGGQFYWWRKRNTRWKLPQVTDKLCTRILHEVHLAMISTRTHNWVLPYDDDHDGPLLTFDFSLKLHWRHWQYQPNIILNFDWDILITVKIIRLFRIISIPSKTFYFRLPNHVILMGC
jgi:hypothetical protein